MSGRQRQVLALARVCRAVQSPYFSDDCCVAATRAGLMVLEDLGIRKARPLLVRAVAHNRAFDQGLRDPPAAFIAVDCEDESPEHLAGHLVIVAKVASQKFLLDLSAYQMDRPHKGIHVESGVAIGIAEWLSHESAEWSVEIPLPQGGRLLYGRHPHHERVAWQRSPNWTLPTSRHEAIFRTVVRELLAATRRHADPSQGDPCTPRPPID